MTSIYRQAEFLDQDEELLHKAMLLMGDEKAKAISVIREYKELYGHLHKKIINYLEEYAEYSLISPATAYAKHNIKTRDVMEPIQLTDKLWWAIMVLRNIRVSRPIIMPALLPFSVYELRLKTYENYPTGHLPKW